MSCDRSSDRNEQHQAIPRPHPAYSAYPLRTLRRGRRPHLLTAGSPPSPSPPQDQGCRSTRVPQQGVSSGHLGSLLTTADPGHGLDQGCTIGFPSSRPNTGASGGPRSGMTPGPGPDSGGSPGERVSRHIGAGGVANRRAGVQIVQPLGAPSGPLPSGSLRDKLADVTGYPLPAPPVLRQANTPRAR